MKVYYDRKQETWHGRTHPWVSATYDPEGRYYNFIKEPELIRASLEGFRDLGHLSSVTRFYELLEWVNGPESLLETNDCAIRPPRDNKDQTYPFKREFIARVMVFFRDYPLNVRPDTCMWLSAAFEEYLKPMDPGWDGACVGITRFPTLFEAMPQDQERQGFIQQLHVWAWGNDDAEANENMARTWNNVLSVCRSISEEVKEAQTRAP